MIKNYLTVAIRNLSRNKGFTFINIMGLALGITSGLLIVLYIVDELSYDRYNPRVANLYRANLDVKYGDNADTYASQAAAFGPKVKQDFPEVSEAARIVPAFYHPTGFRIRKGNSTLQEKSIVYADPGLFAVFSFPLLEGNPATALQDPNTVVLTESAAKKYFGRTDIVGETLLLDDTANYKVTGVMKDIPRQSHFRFDLFLSLASLDESRDPNNWGGGGYNTYLMLSPTADVQKLDSAFSSLVMQKNHDWLGKNDHLKVSLMPVTDLHLRSNLQQELAPNGSIQYVYVFAAIALVILLIACVNFMNLSTARSAGRAKEVGVRKMLGSPRRSLIFQFLTESLLVTCFATLMAIALTLLLLPAFNNLAGKQLAFGWPVARWLLPSALVMVFIISLLAGSYPAFFLSAFQPVDVLKGKWSTGFKGGGLRSILVVIQFSISIFLIASTIIIYKQLHYIQTRDLGYNRDQLLIVKNVAGLQRAAGAFKQKIRQLPGVSSATLTTYVPTTEALHMAGMFPNADPNATNSMLTQFWPVDEDYMKTLGMEIKAGRNFSADMPTDSSAVIINEAAARFLGFKEPLNKTIYQHYPAIMPWHIVGEVKDFNFRSLRKNVTPVIFYFHEDDGALNIKVNTPHLATLMGKIKEVWQSFSPHQAFDYSFVDADFDASYHAEARTGTIFMVFTALAIAIACLGLFGLAAYAAEQRSREIGIRKVLGAGIPGLVALLSTDFIRLVGLAFLIASPLAYLTMQRWLQGFAFRTAIDWWVLPVAGISSGIIAFVTISFQSMKAARANPVESLKIV
jgi:putative ABC transport system permease protein